MMYVRLFSQFFGLAIGFSLLAAVLATGGISGACLNPAIATGSQFLYHYLYILFIYERMCQHL
jgi:glycerol uptake facilitator-like aquaporin